MAAILFTDIVAYSTLTNDRQRTVAQGLNECCLRFLLPEFREQRLAEIRKTAIAAMPTGDGIVVCLLESSRDKNLGTQLLKLAVKLQRWGRQEGIALRTGIHSGDLVLIEDVNQQRNVCGHAINIAQRIMDCGNEGHILCSEDAYLSYYSGYHDKRLPGLGLVKVTPLLKAYRLKHDMEVKLRNIVISQGAQAYGNTDEPPIKHTYRVVPYREKQLLEEFYSCKELTLVGVTCDQIKSVLDNIVSRRERKWSWERLSVYYLTVRSYSTASAHNWVVWRACAIDLGLLSWLRRAPMRGEPTLACHGGCRRLPGNHRHGQTRRCRRHRILF